MWTAQLHTEFEQILFHHRVKLKRPLIEVIDLKSIWGSWEPESRTIRIAYRLIIEHSWEVVVCILKHEMAHQIVSEIYRTPAGHGEEFLTACRLIGVPEPFRSATGDLPQARPGQWLEAGTEADRPMEKVRKLLALAQSSNEHEAGLAMRKANQLIMKYNLERIEQRRESSYSYRIINAKKKKLQLTRKRICSILSEFFFVEVILSCQYDAVSNETHKTIELLGTVENVEIAEYVYYFLLRQLENLWRRHQQETGCPGSRKRSYQLGVLKGFSEKLASQVINAGTTAGVGQGSGCKATCLMVLQKDTKLHDFVSERYPRLSRRKSRAASVDLAGYDAGRQDGRKLTLHRGVSNTGQIGGLLPER
ncbi:MAG: hypothetical protein A2511_09450 [Deltaproteobacteria bacterium RIFOXYD12_FULL_50_9]|nr:MAG: hypothetical protein A2511_09450 [Deltaproteobacteria bacterium RIFOXYD12_FULL_50_9]